MPTKCVPILSLHSVRTDCHISLKIGTLVDSLVLSLWTFGSLRACCCNMFCRGGNVLMLTQYQSYRMPMSTTLNVKSENGSLLADNFKYRMHFLVCIPQSSPVSNISERALCCLRPSSWTRWLLVCSDYPSFHPRPPCIICWASTLLKEQVRTPPSEPLLEFRQVMATGPPCQAGWNTDHANIVHISVLNFPQIGPLSKMSGNLEAEILLFVFFIYYLSWAGK